jgi:hypothetical protein
MYLNLMADKALDVTPSDTVPIAYPAGNRLGCSGLYVGTGGNLTVVMTGADDNADTHLLENVPDGTFLPIKVKFVMATGTTATGILALL